MKKKKNTQSKSKRTRELSLSSKVCIQLKIIRPVCISELKSVLPGVIAIVLGVLRISLVTLYAARMIATSERGRGFIERFWFGER